MVLRAVHHDQVGPRSLEAYGLGLAIFLGVVPALGLLEAGKLEEHQPRGLPTALELLEGAATDEKLAAVLRDGGRHALPVLLVEGSVGDFDVDDDVGSHGVLRPTRRAWARRGRRTVAWCARPRPAAASTPDRTSR